MHFQATAGTITVAAITVIVLLIGKALPKLIAVSGSTSLILAGYLLIAVGWLYALSMISGAHLSTLLGGWRTGWFLWGLLFGLLLFVVSGLGYAVAARLGLNPPAEASMASDFTGVSALLLVILVVVLAVLEEWLFRGVVLNFLQSKSAALAVIGSAVAFALYHLSVFQLLPTLLLGLGLGIIVVYFGTLWPAIVAHTVFNILGVLMSAMGRYS